MSFDRNELVLAKFHEFGNQPIDYFIDEIISGDRKASAALKRRLAAKLVKDKPRIEELASMVPEEIIVSPQ
jgi:hypothetical protein